MRWRTEDLADLQSRGKGKISENSPFRSVVGGQDAKPRSSVRKPKRDVKAEYELQLRLAGLPPPEPEYRFHDERRWAFDWAWSGILLAVEYEGGIWENGRHTRGEGFQRDCEKYNEAALMGWRVLRFTYDFMVSGLALEQTLRAHGRC